MVDFCLKNNVTLWLDPVEINESLPHLKSLSLYRLSRGELKKLMEQMKYWAAAFDTKTLLPYIKNWLALIKEQNPKSIACQVGSSSFVLDVDYNLYPCFFKKRFTFRQRSPKKTKGYSYRSKNRS